MDALKRIPQIRQLLEAADDAGVTSVDTGNEPERLIVRIFFRRPALIRLLYRIRAPLVRLPAFRQDPLPA